MSLDDLFAAAWIASFVFAFIGVVVLYATLERFAPLKRGWWGRALRIGSFALFQFLVVWYAIRNSDNSDAVELTLAINLGLIVAYALLCLLFATGRWWGPPLIKRYPDFPVRRFWPTDYTLKTPAEFTTDIVAKLIREQSAAKRNVPQVVAETMQATIEALYQQCFPTEAPQEQLNKDRNWLNNRLKVFDEALTKAFRVYLNALPQGYSPFSAPISSLMNVWFAVQEFVGIGYLRNDKNDPVFYNLFERINNNYHALQNAYLSPREKESGKRVSHDLLKAKKEDIARAYLRGTPFHQLFTLRLPLPIESYRLEHMFVLAPPGTGKTQLIQAMIVDDLDKVKAGEASLMVIDSQGISRRQNSDPTLIDNLTHLEMFATDLKDRFVYIKPGTHLAFNIFDMGQNDPRLTAEQRAIRAASAGHIIMTALGGSSDLQFHMLGWCVELALLTPNPTILTLREILTEDDEKSFQRKYGKYLPKADTATQQFFARFTKGSRGTTREALIMRIDGILREKTFRSMLTKPTNDFILIDALEAGKMIVIDADKAILGDAGAEAFGRFFLGQLLQASRQRTSTKPFFCYCDEAQDFLKDDENISVLLTQARKQHVGMILATQNLANINSLKVRENLQDAAIQVEAAKGKPRGTFNVCIRNGETVEVKVQGRVMEDLKRMSDDQHEEMFGQIAEATPTHNEEETPKKSADDDVL